MSSPSKILRSAYRPPAFSVPSIRLRVDIWSQVARVSSLLSVQPSGADADLELDADWSMLELQEVSIDGERLSEGEFEKREGKLVVSSGRLPRAEFSLRTTVTQEPAKNTSLDGLYKEGSGFVTQMEAFGYRRFSPFFDRPDVLSKYTVELTAPASTCPVLLSNGDCVSQGQGGSPSGSPFEDWQPAADSGLELARHWAVFEDPWPKPCYLFAVVAGDLGRMESEFVRADGRPVRLEAYAPAADVGKCGHALESLKRAMRWDEEMYGRVYDLDTFRIVATHDFNMGAMENKSLNVFNTKYVLGNPKIATDKDLEAIEAVVAHEYFHNYSGNRVTVKSFFDLTLKEGLTVFRDEEFTSDVASRGIKRVEDASGITSRQFAEDSGSMSHPARPAAVAAMNNLYSATVYDKGAELVRMYRTILGSAAYRRGTDWYFSTFDGQAVTCDDFALAMEAANWPDLPAPSAGAAAEGVDADPWLDAPYDRLPERPLSQFRRWYSVAGTPEVTVEREWDAATRTLSLEVSQTVPPTAGQEGEKPALHIPVSVALLGPDGRELSFALRPDASRWDARWGGAMAPLPDGAATCGPDLPSGDAAGTTVLHVTEKRQRFVLESVAGDGDACPVLSVLRGFSAPVRVTVAGDGPAEVALRAAHDADPYNRWCAVSDTATAAILSRVAAPGAGEAPAADAEASGALVAACRSMLDPTSGVDPALAALAVDLPPTTALVQAAKRRDGCVDPAAVAGARAEARRALGEACGEALAAAVARADAALGGRAYSVGQADAGQRALRATALGLLAQAGDAAAVARAEALQREGDNLTDVWAGVRALARLPAGDARREAALAGFLAANRGERLVENKWLALRAVFGTVEEVEALMEHDVFDIGNPNCVYALLRTFGAANFEAFHAPSGTGYAFLARCIATVDARNPQVAARLAACFSSAASLAPALQRAVRSALEPLVAGDMGKAPSTDVAEILSGALKSLAAE